MSSAAIKSITPVRYYGAGNNGNWGARMRLQDGTELFSCVGAGYTLAQAEAAIRANPDNTPVGNSSVGLPATAPYQPLPEGVKAKA